MRVFLTSIGFLSSLLVRLAALQPVLSAGARHPSSSRTEAVHVASVLHGLERMTVGRNASVGVNLPQPLCAQPEQCLFMTADSTCSNPSGRCSQANVLYDCRACNCFCPKNEGLPFLYDFPTRALTSFRNARCDTSNTNVGPMPDPNKAGIYCCFQCFLWRSINTNCPATGDCWPNIGTDFNDPFVKQAQSPSVAFYPHFLIIPPSQVTGIEDAQRNLVAHWTGVYNVMLFPRRYLDQSGGNNPFPGGAVPSGWSGPFPDAQQRIWIGGGINQADSRSQHQMHVHYAILPQPLRLVLTKAAWPPHPWPQGVCQDLKVQTTNTAIPPDRRDVTFGAYFFREPIEKATWDPRTLAKGCPNVWSQVAVPAGMDPFSADDLTMADISMMIVPGDNVTTAGQPLGYYVLVGNRRRGGFRAETMLCTQQGLDSYWLNANCIFNNWRLPVVPPKGPAENETFCPVCSQAAPINPDPSASTICESLIVTRLTKKSKGTVCTTVTVDRFHEINGIGEKVPVFRFCFASASPAAAKTCKGTTDRGVLAGAFLNHTEATFGVSAGELDFSDRVNVRNMCPRQLLMSDDGTTCGDVSTRSSKHSAKGYDAAVLFNPATTGFKPNDAFMGCFEVRNAVRFTPPKAGFSMALAFNDVKTDNGRGLKVTTGNQVCARCAESTRYHHQSGIN